MQPKISFDYFPQDYSDLQSFIDDLKLKVPDFYAMNIKIVTYERKSIDERGAFE